MENVAIKSTKRIKDTNLHPYTNGEEIFNWVSHLIGAVFGIAVLIACICVSVINDNPWGLAGSIVYGITIIILYTNSTIYHALKPSKAKKVLRVLDHCTIYLLIAGTYMPLLLSPIRQENAMAAYVIMGVELGTAILAITLTAIDMKRFISVSMACYLILGWAILPVIHIAFRALPLPAFILLFIGGIAYTIGSVLYGLGKNHKYMHSVFHLFCLAGTVAQFACIIMIL